ncbi:helix-turn-helix domain-containing protein [Bradyrhizobium sp. BR 1432]|uniref:helix-turn-helix domain-containing protein n=1 Tax=Bradyrhizobium sp. BR 1432 TaxID=3447966 RepID=UPI003EE4F101
MAAFWGFIASNFSHLPATGLLLVAGLSLFGYLALKAVSLFLAVRLSRKAIERGYSVEVSAGREFYFRIPASKAATISKASIAKPRLTAPGSRIRILRRKRKCTLATLSAASNIAVPRLSALETGRAELLTSDIDAICQALHLSEEEAADLKRLAGPEVHSTKRAR